MNTQGIEGRLYLPLSRNPKSIQGRERGDDNGEQIWFFRRLFGLKKPEEKEEIPEEKAKTEEKKEETPEKTKTRQKRRRQTRRRQTRRKETK